MRINHPIATCVCVLLLAALSETSEARSIRVDDTLQEFQFTGGLAPPINVLSGDGSSPAVPIQSYNLDTGGSPDFSSPLPFSVNVFGVTYSSLYVNENGNLSFGGAFGGRPGNSDPSNAGVPVFAPFFADVDSDLSPFGGSISHGFFPEINGIAVTWSSVGYNGQDAAADPRRVSMQVVIIDISDMTGVAGDFRFEFNYEGGSGGMAWETGDADGGVNGLGGMSALAGFWDGAGLGYEIPGSGVNGALLGDACGPNSLALSCNDYFFEFRNGVPVFLDGTPVIDPAPVPEPGILALFGIGLAAMGLCRRRKIA